MKQPIFASRNSQRGVALVVVLVLLLIMTLLGLASLRGTLLEERMSANLFDRSLSFQAAEAALREAEQVLAANPTFPTTGECSDEGLCPTPVATETERWRDGDFDGWHEADAEVGTLVAAQPEYFVEFMGTAPSWPFCDREIPQSSQCMKSRYRITARSSADDRAMVLLQSNYAAP